MKNDLKLKSIDEEEADCRKAFEGSKIEDLVWHCHHEILMEHLTEPPESRIDYILLSKPSSELAMRLRLFRPFLGALPESLKKVHADWQKVYADYPKAYADYLKAFRDYPMVYADYLSPYADRFNAGGDMEKAVANWLNAGTDLEKAVENWQKAYTDFAISVHNKFCKECPWNGKTIFPNA